MYLLKAEKVLSTFACKSYYFKNIINEIKLQSGVRFLII